MARTTRIAILLASFVLATTYGWSLFAGEPQEPAVTPVWPKWHDDADDDKEGDQPGYKTEGEDTENTVKGHTDDSWKVAVHVAPPRDENGDPVEVCDAHFIPPKGAKFDAGRVSESNVSNNPVWAHVPETKTGEMHFHSEDCDQDMPPNGLTFVFSVSAKDKPQFRDYKIYLTNDGGSETPPSDSEHIVAVLRETSEGHPLRYPFAACMAAPPPGGTQAGMLGNVHLVTQGEQVELVLASRHPDSDYELLMSRSLDEDGTDGSGSGINAVSDPVPAVWGVEFSTGERWVNSEQRARDAMEFPAGSALEGEWIYVAAGFHRQGEIETRWAAPTTYYVIHDEDDYDGDGAANELDLYPLDPSDW